MGGGQGQPSTYSTGSSPLRGEASVHRVSWMRAARAAAPKPLSMFTTATPVGAAVQHAEQGRQAAEAGAVADAGGHGDDRDRGPRPPTTLGRAPSMPATTMMTAAASRPAALAEQPVEAGDADVVEPLDLDAHRPPRETAASSATGMIRMCRREQRSGRSRLAASGGSVSALMRRMIAADAFGSTGRRVTARAFSCKTASGRTLRRQMPPGGTCNEQIVATRDDAFGDRRDLGGRSCPVRIPPRAALDGARGGDRSAQSRGFRRGPPASPPGSGRAPRRMGSFLA